jgi:hypothetical protein
VNVNAKIMENKMARILAEFCDISESIDSEAMYLKTWRYFAWLYRLPTPFLSR